MKNHSEPEIIYHYTSIKCLHSILDNVVEDQIDLHLNSLLNMNDSFEGNAGLNILRRYFNMFNEQDRKKHVLYDIYNSLKSIQHDNNQGEFDIFSNVFCMSFTKKSDDLSQWRAYGDNGRGVSIGFDYQEIKKAKLLDTSKTARLGAVDYINLENLEDDTLNPLAGFLEKMAKQQHIQQKEYLVGGLCFFKHDAFKNEEEYRLMYNAVNLEAEIGSKLQFKYHNGQIVPYFTIQLPKNAIKRLILGSEQGCPQNLKFLKDFLVYKGFNKESSQITDAVNTEKDTKPKSNVNVTQSKIPYIPK